MEQFHSIENDGHGILHWPGDLEGLPVLHSGRSTPLLRQHEVEEELETVAFFHTGSFDLWVEEQRKQYEQIMTRIGAGWYKLAHATRIPSPDNRSVTVVLEWYQRYASVPKRVMQRME